MPVKYISMNGQIASLYSKTHYFNHEFGNGQRIFSTTGLD